MRHNEVEYPFLPRIRTPGSPEPIRCKEKKESGKIACKNNSKSKIRTAKICMEGESLAPRPLCNVNIIIDQHVN